VQFFVVYIREAHALDGRSPLGGGNHPILEEPVSLAERNAIATTCMAKLELEPIPALVDGMDNGVNKAYAAAPDRLYLVGKDGRIVFHGDRGPFGFKPELLLAAIRKELGEGGEP
jgi:hypothetical protein